MPKKRQLTEEEKVEIIKQHGRVCFVDGEPIPEDERIEFHHIKPYSEGGPSTLENIAPVCRKHHLTLGTMSLQEYRDKLEMARFFGRQPIYLDDVIRERARVCGEVFNYDVKGDETIFYFDKGPERYKIYECPVSGWPYFYANIPIIYIRNDKELQPRPIREPAMWNLYRHFQINTQLAPSICRITEDGSLLLFDGQHKAAAQIWAGRERIECKVYIKPTDNELKETNLEAHGKFRQMSFYSHELMEKYASIFGEDWAEYLETKGVKSEKGFFEFLKRVKGKTKGKARNEISLAMFNEILENPENKLSRYISEKHRGRKLPLTFARLKKTFLQHMLLPPPVDVEFESDVDFRKVERTNLVKLMNIIVEEELDGKWAPDRADASHKKAEREFSAGAIRGWVILLKDAINTHLRHYTDEERDLFFFRPIPDEDFEFFRNFVKRLFSHKIWDDPDPSGEIAARLAKDDIKTVRSLFEESGLNVQWILRADSN